MHGDKQPVVVEQNWGFADDEGGIAWSKLQLQHEQHQQHQQKHPQLMMRSSTMEMRNSYGWKQPQQQHPTVSNSNLHNHRHHQFHTSSQDGTSFILLDPWRAPQDLQHQEAISLSLSGGGGLDASSSSGREWFFMDDKRRPTKNFSNSSSSSSMVMPNSSAGEWDELLSLRPPNSTSNHSELTHVSSASGESSRGIKRGREAVDEDKFGPPPSSKQRLLPSSSASSSTTQPGLHLVNILLECAQALDRNDRETTISLLAQLQRGASVSGDSMQRLAAHFSEALAARASAFLAKNPNSLPRVGHNPSPTPAKNPNASNSDDYLSAFTALYKVSPFFQIAHFTANQAILDATEGDRQVHIIDLDILQGFQWPSLMQAMASRPGGPPSLLRITGLGSSEESLRETGKRLASFASNFSVPFEFKGVSYSDDQRANFSSWFDRVELRSGEAVALNSMFRLHRLLGCGGGGGGGPSSILEGFLATVATKVKPQVVTIVEQEASHNTPAFMPRFMEALHYYAAVFDSLDASLPQRNEERLRIESVMFAKQIRNIVACEGEERVERHETMGFWANKLGAAGFRQIPLSSHAVRQARLLLQMCPCDGYRLVESPSSSSSGSGNSASSPSSPQPSVGSISLAWQDDRLLLTTSAWACAADSSSNPCSPLSF